MSLSAKFEKSQADFQQATRAASLDNISRAMDKMAAGFPGAVSGIVARKAKGKEPNWFQKRKTEKWIWTNKGVTASDITPEFLEDIPGFRKLRDACADPAMDIKLRIYVTSGSDMSLKIDLDPTRPFKESVIDPASDSFADDDFLPGVSRTMRKKSPKPQSVAITVPVAAPATVAQNTGKIPVLSPLRLNSK
jgi:hypothetical protein